MSYDPQVGVHLNDVYLGHGSGMLPGGLYALRHGSTGWNKVRAQGKFAQAEALAKQTVETDRRVLGAEHAETLNSMSALADVYTAQGKYAQAEPLYSHTLEI
jgi:hypothetical protein